MPTELDFYFDFSSAYSYIGQHRIKALAAEHDLAVHWRPIALGVIFKARNHAPPSPDTPVGAYIWHDVGRCAAECGLALVWPQAFPFNSMTAARMFYLLQQRDAGLAQRWAEAVFGAAFGEGRDCASPEVLAGLATDIGLDGPDLVAQTREDAAKQALQAATQAAMERGVFGAPTFFLGGEMYWGADRIDQMRRILTGTPA